jgi:hypothetical protein
MDSPILADGDMGRRGEAAGLGVGRMWGWIARARGRLGETAGDGRGGRGLGGGAAEMRMDSPILADGDMWILADGDMQEDMAGRGGAGVEKYSRGCCKIHLSGKWFCFSGLGGGGEWGWRVLLDSTTMRILGGFGLVFCFQWVGLVSDLAVRMH